MYILNARLQEYKATQKTCPDGLYFIRDVQWPSYPCAYPSDAKCEYNDQPREYIPDLISLYTNYTLHTNNSLNVLMCSAERAVSSADCKTRYGFFASPLATRSDCGKYRMCVEGKAFEMECAMGLAFNPESGRCDWPDLVPSCSAEGTHTFLVLFKVQYIQYQNCY